MPAILTTDEHQIIFVDAPGLLEPRYALQEAMRWSAERAIEDADAVVLVADATRPDTLPDPPTLEALQEGSKGVVIAVNKIDRVTAAEAKDLASHCKDYGYDVCLISSTKGSGVDELLRTVARHLPVMPALFPEEYTSTLNLRFFAEEYVREACLEQFREEVPHSIVSRVEEFREDEDPIFIRVHIYVERKSQKGIVIGRGGGAIKRVGQKAREAIETLIGRKVYLELRVKVMPRWSRMRGSLRHLGFEVPPEGVSGR